MIEILAQSSSGSSPFTLLIFLLPIGLLFFMMRAQKRRMQQQQALQQAAEVGDEVLTTSGIFGTIIETDDDEGTVIVEIAPGTRIKMVRAGISRTITEDEAEAEVDVTDDDDNASGPILQ
jgi:preprotein translocase subunit YajC